MRKIRSSAERYRAFLLFASARAWTIWHSQVSRQTRGNEKGTYEFDKLALNDIFYQIYCVCERFLYLTKDEHLQRTAKNSWESLGSPGLDFALRTIWEISCWYLYSFFFSSAGAAVVFLAGVIICGLTKTNWTVTGSG
jgi:hypothetical protein